ncbi:MAG: hypothetical protein O3C40_20370 [Planctomycetota bacterium]|nr:hypothetical protein [Planctomycetota bacterium]
MNSDQIRAEEEKRERQWNPADRWRILQETIAWTAAQSTAKRNTIEARLAEQNRKLVWFADHHPTKSNSHPT